MKYLQGKFKPTHPDKYVGDLKNIVFRSSWERRFMKWCDSNTSVLKWGSEIYPIQYVSSLDGRTHRYFIDFFVRLRTKDGEEKSLAIEIKPKSQTVQPVKGRKRDKTYMTECMTWIKNQDKWKAARAWAKKNGIEFLIMTEEELGIKHK